MQNLPTPPHLHLNQHYLREGQGWGELWKLEQTGEYKQDPSPPVAPSDTTDKEVWKSKRRQRRCEVNTHREILPEV